MKETKTRAVAYMGLLFALAIALSYLEGLVPALPGLPPGVKLGLSNIVTMYCLFFRGGRPALLLAFLKSGFVLLSKGSLIAAALSLAGGLCSILVMLLLRRALGGRGSYFGVSAAGGVAHNAGQLAAAMLILQTPALLYYLPVLILSGVAMGAVTGKLLRVALPRLRQLESGKRQAG